jgi:hypothetical protein
MQFCSEFLHILGRINIIGLNFANILSFYLIGLDDFL